MKKYILFLTLSLAILPASAQFFFSGIAGYDMTKYKRSQGFDKTLPDSKSILLSLRAGYNLNPSLQAGITLHVTNSISSTSNGYFDRDKEIWINTELADHTRATFGGGLFLRYLCAELGNFTISADLAATYSYGLGVFTQTQYDYRSNFPIVFKTPFNLNQLQLKLVPIVSYRFDSHFSLEAYLDLLALALTRTSLNQQKIYEVDEYDNNPSLVTDYILTTTSFHIGQSAENPYYLTLGLTYKL